MQGQCLLYSPMGTAVGLRCLPVVLSALCGLGACANFTADSASGSGGEDTGTGGAGGGLGGGAGGGDGGAGGIVLSTDPPPVTQKLGLVCRQSLGDSWPTFEWELTIDPGPIEADGKFSARFRAETLFPRTFLEVGQSLILGGASEANVFDFQLTVRPYAGALGSDVVLGIPADWPFHCELEDPSEPGTRPTCDPANDAPGVGPFANSDCDQPFMGPTNPCGRFVDVPISLDCAPNGECSNVGRDDSEVICNPEGFCQDTTQTQCDVNGFCVTGDLPFTLGPVEGEFLAEADGEVRFGWYEPDRGGWWPGPPQPILPYPAGENGLRFYVGPIGVAMECVLGEEKMPGMTGPVPDEGLIAFEIPESACEDGTQVCPPGFTSMRQGLCKLRKADEPVFVEDPIIHDDPSQSSCEGPSTYPFISDSYAPSAAGLSSSSLVVKATTEMRNVDDDACVPSGDIIANVEYFDEEDALITNTLLSFDVSSSRSFSRTNSTIRRAYTYVWWQPVAWSSGPQVCCERTFQTIWTITVPQCEGW